MPSASTRYSRFPSRQDIIKLKIFEFFKGFLLPLLQHFGFFFGRGEEGGLRKKASIPQVLTFNSPEKAVIRTSPTNSEEKQFSNAGFSTHLRKDKKHLTVPFYVLRIPLRFSYPEIFKQQDLNAVVFCPV